jgi:hypothetical protein
LIGPVFQTGKHDEVNVMKQMLRKVTMILMIPALLVLGGCGGYARTANSSSGVDAYGVIDVGVQHGNR